VPETGSATDRVAQLRRVALLSDLSEATLGDVARRSRARTYARGEHILLEGDPCEVVYFVSSGEVRVYRVSAEGREQVLVRLTEGQAFNTVPAFIEDGRNPANAAAETETRLLSIPAAELRTLTLRHADLSQAVLQDFAGRLVHLTDLASSLGLLNVRQRLVKFLVGQATGAQPDRQQSGGEDGMRAVQLGRRWTQNDIAAHLGTVRDVVGRALRALEEEGLVRLDRGRIVLLDRGGLERLADLA